MPNRKFSWWPNVSRALYDHPKKPDPAVTRAMERLSKTPEGQEANALILLVYFKRRNTLDGAAALCGITNRTATRRIRKAFFYIAEEKGYISPSGGSS